MTTIRFISGQAALVDFIHGIHVEVDKGLDARNINASGRLKRSNRTEVAPGVGSTSATLYALSYWKNAGSGSPPGTKAEPSDLAQWAIDKGLANNDRAALKLGYLVARKIERFGSKQYREGGDNVYDKAIEAARPKIPDVLRAFLSDYRQPIAAEFAKALA